MYKLFPNALVGQLQCVKRLSDNACIPFDSANTDFLEYQKWLREGNIPLPADEPSSSETV